MQKNELVMDLIVGTQSLKDIVQYNKELLASEKEIEEGKFYTHPQVKDHILRWREE